MLRWALSAKALPTRTTFIASVILASFGQSVRAQTSYSWAASTSANWNDATQWTPTAGPGVTFPVAGDMAAFNGANASVAETIFLNGNQAASSLTFSNTSTTAISTGASGGPLVNNQSLTLTGGITVNSGAGAVAIGASVASNNVLIVASGNQSFTNNSASLFTIGNGASTSNVSLQGGAGAPSVITFTGTGNITMEGEIKDGGSGGVVSVIKSGSGTLELDGNASGTFFTGGMTMNSGTLNLKGSNNFGTTANTLTINGGTVASVGSARTIPAAISVMIGGDITLGTSTTGGQAITFNGPINLGGATRKIVFNNSATFAGAITNGGITKAPSGSNNTTLTLSGANTYAGPTTIQAGTITAITTSGGTDVFSPNSPVILPSGGTLALAGFSQTIASLSDGGGPGGNVTIGNLIAGVLTLGGDNSSTTFSGSISGNGSTSGGGITKIGAGTFTLSNPAGNSYGSAANAVNTVLNGALLVTNTSNSATGPGAVNVMAAPGSGGAAAVGTGGALGGTGIISGPITISSNTPANQGGIVDPGLGGGSAGTLNVGSMAWNPFGRYVFAHSATNSVAGGGVNNYINATGSLDLSNLAGNNPFDLNLLPLSLPTTPNPQTYTIATFANGITGAGNVTGVPFANGDISYLFTLSGSYFSAAPSFAAIVPGSSGGQAIQLTFIPSSASTWSGTNSGSWNDSGDWSPAFTPVSNINAALTFGATTHAVMTNDIPGTLTLNSLTFNSGAPAYALSGNGLIFATNIIGGLPQIASNSANAVTIGVALTLANNLTVNGSGNVALNGAIGGAGSLTASGTGTLTLGNAANNYSGGTNVTNSTVQVAADGALGTGNVSVTGLGNLLYTGTTSTSRIFNLSSGGRVSVAGGHTLTLSGAQMTGGYLSGPGTFATNPASGAVFANVTTRPSATINSNSSLDRYLNVTNGGALNVAAGLTSPISFVGMTNAGSGSITVAANSLVNITDTQSYGLLTLSNGSGSTSTTMTNVGTTPLSLNSGSRTIIGSIGGNGLADLELNGQNAIVAGGLFVNNGHVSDNSIAGISTIIADYGALVKGAGLYDNSPITRNGGKFQSGNSPGVATLGRFVFGPGGVSNYVFAISNATGQAGPTPDANGDVSGWGLVKTGQWQRSAGATSGDFVWTADSTNKLTVTLDTLIDPTVAGTDVNGLMANFDPNKAYSWPAVEWVGTYSGPTNVAALNADTTFDTSEFANPVAGAFGWSLDPASQTLSLSYTPSAVPEPGTLCLVGIAAAGLAWRRRRTVPARNR